MSTVGSCDKQAGIDTSKEEKDIELVCKSIERSRKRLLSPGILRGDLAVDRLALQEAGASPLLKKSRPSPSTSPQGSPNMAMTMAEFRAYMDATTNKKLDSQGAILSDLQGTVRGIEKRVDNNSEMIAKHDRIIEQNKLTIEELKKKANAPAPAAHPGMPAPASGREADKEAEFLRARRSLRMWPIGGNTVREIWKATGDFMRVKLQLEHIMRDEWIESIIRAQVPSGPGVRSEVVVLFKNDKERDTVLGACWSENPDPCPPPTLLPDPLQIWTNAAS